MATTLSTNVLTANVPAHIAARIAARQQAGTKSAVTAAIVGDGIQIPRISIKAGRYRLVESGVETVVGISLDTVVVGANPRVSKVFYAKQYDSAAENVRPDCFSNDGMKPDASVQNPVSAGCANCPNNVLGSKVLPSGAKSKMCADQRHLAVVPAADPSKVYSLTVPVSGMKGMREYFKELDNYNIVPEEVVTQLGFDESASYPKITFKQTGYVPESMTSVIDELAKSDDTKVATREMLPFDRAPALAAPQSQQALTSAPAPAVAQAPAPAPVAPPAPPVDDAYEEEAAAAPAVVVAAPAPAARPAVAPVTASSELTAKLDALFGG
jgi:hypothetical protein